MASTINKTIPVAGSDVDAVEIRNNFVAAATDIEALQTSVAAVDAAKVDKVTGKGLSENDYTTAEKSKLAGIAAGAQVNAVTSVNGQTGDVVVSGGGGFAAVAFSTTLAFDGTNKEMAQQAITGATAFTSTGSTVGTQINVCLVANGTNIPTFPTNFKEATGSSGFDNAANVKNYYQFIYTNNKVIYSVFQEVGDTGATDITAPTLSSAVVQNATPTVVAVTYSEALDQTVTQDAGDWAVSGHTVSSVAFASSTVINLTVSSAFVYGEATRTVTYTNDANRVKDLAGNAALTSSATNITNNVTTVPSQVTGLTVGTVTSSSIAVSWTAPSNGGSAITDYIVQTSPDNSTWTTFSDGTSTTTSTVVTGIPSSTLRYIRVAAINANGTGIYSTSVSATTSASATAPAQVTGLTLGTPTSDSQPLTWTAPSDGGSAITDYLIEYKETSSGTWLTFSDGTSTTASTTVTGLTASTSYDYRVSAINAIGTGTASATGTGSTASSSTPLLDTYTGAALALGMRKLRTAYSGSAIRIRRSSDNTEQDIGFDGSGNLDTSAISTFVGANSAYVKTWYDQSGNGRDFTQTDTARQPRIVNAGTIDVEGSIPAIVGDGSDDILFISSTTGLLNGISHVNLFSVLKSTDTTATSRMAFYASTNDVNGVTRFNLMNSSGTANRLQSYWRRLDADASANVLSSTNHGGTQHQVSSIINYSAGTATLYQDGTSVATGTPTTGTSSATDPAYTGVFGYYHNAGAGLRSQHWQGTIQEIILYTTDQSSNRTSIEDDQAGYY